MRTLTGIALLVMAPAIAFVLLERPSYGCAVKPAAPPGAQQKGRTATPHDNGDGSVTVTSTTSATNRDKSAHIVLCWDEGTSSESETESAEAPGKPNQNKTTVKTNPSPAPSGSGSHTLHYVAWWDDANGNVTWSTQGTIEVTRP